MSMHVRVFSLIRGLYSIEATKTVKKSILRQHKPQAWTVLLGKTSDLKWDAYGPDIFSIYLLNAKIVNLLIVNIYDAVIVRIF